MDNIQARSLADALQAVADEHVHLTPQATILLIVAIDAIGDDPNGRAGDLHIEPVNIQGQVISRVPKILPAIARHYRTDTVDGLMMLNVMPRFMSGFCPPFQNPPPAATGE